MQAMEQTADEPRREPRVDVDSAELRMPSYAGRLAMNAVVMGIGEAMVISGSLVLGGFIRWAWKGSPMLASWMVVLVLAWVAGAFFAKLLPGWGLGPVEELRRSTLLIMGVFAASTIMVFWGKGAESTSRFTLTTGFLISVLLMPVVRIQIKRFLIQRNGWGIPVVLYTDRNMADTIVRVLREEGGLGYTPAGFFSSELARKHTSWAGIPVLGGDNDVMPKASVAVLAGHGLGGDRLTTMLEGPLSHYRRVLIVPDLADAPSLWVKPRDLMGLLGLEIPSNLLDPTARFLKRTFDILTCLVTAPVWIPLCILIAILIWLEDRGSPVFLQERIGMKGQSFKAWKFRTMHKHAEKILMDKLKTDEALRDEWETNFKLRNDPRVTRIGRLLRKTSLDELPQCINVLIGEMSLVGPRPLPAYHHEELPSRTRTLRERVRPGITGLWQVSGRSNTGTAGMDRWDTYYVRNWSIWLDVVIFVRTIRTVTTGHGAF